MWEPPTCPSVDESIDKPEWNIIQPQKRKEIVTYTTAWMNVEDIMFIAKPATKRQRLYVSTCMRHLE